MLTTNTTATDRRAVARGVFVCHLLEALGALPADQRAALRRAAELAADVRGELDMPLVAVLAILRAVDDAPAVH